MSTIEKLIFKLKTKPNGIQFREIVRVLDHFGYSMKSKKRNIT